MHQTCLMLSSSLHKWDVKQSEIHRFPQLPLPDSLSLPLTTKTVNPSTLRLMERQYVQTKFKTVQKLIVKKSTSNIFLSPHLKHQKAVCRINYNKEKKSDWDECHILGCGTVCHGIQTWTLSVYHTKQCHIPLLIFTAVTSPNLNTKRFIIFIMQKLQFLLRQSCDILAFWLDSNTAMQSWFALTALGTARFEVVTDVLMWTHVCSLGECFWNSQRIVLLSHAEPSCLTLHVEAPDTNSPNDRAVRQLAVLSVTVIPTFFSVSFSQRLILQIWWLLSFLQGAQSPQLSLRWQPVHSPHLLRFFLTGFSPSLSETEGVLELGWRGDLNPAVLDTAATCPELSTLLLPAPSLSVELSSDDARTFRRSFFLESVPRGGLSLYFSPSAPILLTSRTPIGFWKLLWCSCVSCWGGIL